MQLVKEKYKEVYILFNNWGMVGTDGQHQLTPFFKLELAIKEFKSIFFKKTGNRFEERNNF